jgi:NAD(P)-dependent dehydrogenase (short-subunit alcohol dehydrogenase family)
MPAADSRKQGVEVDMVELHTRTDGLSELLLPGTAVVSGGSSGIGLAAVRLLLDRGATVHVASRTPGELESIEGPVRDRLFHHLVDVTDPAAIARLVETLSGSRIDYLVPNAGIARVQDSGDLGGFSDQLAVNHLAAIEMFEAFRPLMHRGSTAVFISTFLRQIAFPGLAGYIASKAALSAWVRTRAVELGREGIRLNLVSPGPTATPIWGNAGLDPATLAQVAQGIEARLLTGKFLDPRQIAQTICFLLASASDGCWGQDWVVDGGYTLS